MARTGRPRREFEKRLFEDLFILGFTKEAIAGFFDLSGEELNTILCGTYDMTFEEMVDAVEYVTAPKRDNDRPYIVYMHITPSGKKYVGVTKSKLNKRWNNGKGYWCNSYFTNAINKYGWDQIQHAILFYRLTKEEAEQKEIEMIRRFKTTDRRYGYNIDGGGSLNKVVSDETREKLRIASTGVKASEETRKKMSEAHKGEKCHFYGIPVTEECKEYLREIRSKPVERLDDDGNVIDEYPSMKAAAKAFGVTRQAISYCCRGKGKKAVGYGWRWKNE